jgi:hypothetical protein
MNELTLSIPILAFPIEPGMVRKNVALLLNTGDAPTGAAFKVVEGDVTIDITGTQTVAGMEVYLVTITASTNAKPGDKTVLASVPGMPAGQQGAIGLLTVVAQLPGKSASLGKQNKPHFRNGRA